MGQFTNFGAFYPAIGTAKTYCLSMPLTWEIGAKGSGWLLTMNAGFCFDISVPRGLEWALNPHDRRVLLAAAVHDELLNLGHDPAFASAEFRRAAIARGVPRAKAWMLFFTTLAWTAFRPSIAARVG